MANDYLHLTKESFLCTKFNPTDNIHFKIIFQNYI